MAQCSLTICSTAFFPEAMMDNHTSTDHSPSFSRMWSEPRKERKHSVNKRPHTKSYNQIQLSILCSCSLWMKNIFFQEEYIDPGMKTWLAKCILLSRSPLLLYQLHPLVYVCVSVWLNTFSHIIIIIICKLIVYRLPEQSILIRWHFSNYENMVGRWWL